MEARDVQRVLDEREPRPRVDVEGELVEADKDDVGSGMDRGVVCNCPSAFGVEGLRPDRWGAGLRMVRDPHDVEAVSVPNARLRGMLGREQEASSRADE